MMVSMDQLQKGLVSYLDNEFMPMLPQNGIERVIIGTGVSLAIKKNFPKFAGLKDHPIVKVMGIFDESGNIDLDTLATEVKKNMTNEGVQIEAPMIGKLTFKKEDVDKLQQYVKGGM